ncbi:MAG: hypothetical protein HQL63_14070 [Magnetococcales bacterium]|nr:hypothetical protein [Magnetococcales bacterium]MBF0322409.1 hypothetical protein [Magnetococcales bacterium]
MWTLIVAFGFIALWLGIVYGILLPKIRRNKAMSALQKCSPFLLPPFSRELDKPQPVAGRNKETLLHQVNLFRLTCTCHRFRTRRGFFPDQDVRRLCYHLRQEIKRQGLLDRFDALSQSIIEDGVRDRCYMRTNVLGSVVGFGATPKQKSVRVYARQHGASDPAEGSPSGPYGRFLFDTAQKKWVNDEAPFGAEVIAREALEFWQGVVADTSSE